METTRHFTEFNLDPRLLKALEDIGFTQASPVQDMTIPAILENKDIFAQAETGSGKTGSFAIPILQKILVEGNQEGTEANDHEVHYIVLSPTRELAQQTDKVFESIGSSLGIHAVCLIGGESIERQKELLRGKISILVATPGRLCDLIKQKSVLVDKCKAVVFDEADRLFDMGFKKEIEYILDQVPRSRQLIMVSATSNLDVLETAYKFHSEPVELKLNVDSLLVDNIDHSLAMLSSNEKMPLLVNILRNHIDTYALIFCNTQIETHRVAEWLTMMGFKAQAISGRLPQNKRTRLMEQFRSKEVTILVCTDVAARGLDIKDVNLVINYELPQEAANYVHRIGRTGRAGKDGRAISFCAHEDCENLDAISALIQTKIPRMNLTDADFAKDICSRPYLDSKTLKVVERPGSRKPEPRRETKAPREENKSRERSSERTPRTNEASVAHKPIILPELPKFVASEQAEGDRRFFIITTENVESAEMAAQGYFQLPDRELLQSEIVKKGMKKFFFFGPQKITYRYSLKPIYKKILTPFLIQILRLARLKLFVNVSYREPMIEISFKGADEKLLERNGFELLQSLEIIAKLYLAKKVQLKPETRLQVKMQSEGNGRPSEPSRSNGRSHQAAPHDLIEMVDKMKQKVLADSEAVLLKPLDSKERRLVHQHLSDDQLVKTTSIGEGRLKRIEISLREQ